MFIMTTGSREQSNDGAFVCSWCPQAVQSGALLSLNGGVRCARRSGGAVGTKRATWTWVERPVIRCAMAAERAGSRGEKKQALVSEVASLDLGRTCLKDETKQRHVNTLIEDVESSNPTHDAALSELLQGDWMVVYTDSADMLGPDRPDVFKARYIRQTLTLTAHPHSGQPGGNEDDENDDGIQVAGDFEVEEGGDVLSLLGIKVPWRNVFNGSFKASRTEVSSTDRCSEYRRIMLKFRIFKLGGIFSIKFPGTSAIGWQDHTYLDDELRIIRTNKGNVVVMRRQLNTL